MTTYDQSAYRSKRMWLVTSKALWEQFWAGVLCTTVVPEVDHFNRYPCRSGTTKSVTRGTSNRSKKVSCVLDSQTAVSITRWRFLIVSDSWLWDLKERTRVRETLVVRLWSQMRIGNGRYSVLFRLATDAHKLVIPVFLLVSPNTWIGSGQIPDDEILVLKQKLFYPISFLPNRFLFVVKSKVRTVDSSLWRLSTSSVS